jgi:hypothetical protein
MRQRDPLDSRAYIYPFGRMSENTSCMSGRAGKGRMYGGWKRRADPPPCSGIVLRLSWGLKNGGSLIEMKLFGG